MTSTGSRFADDSFDVVHAHQVLQHLRDPVPALTEMRRVLRPGGHLAVRDSDYGAKIWAPQDELLDRWMALYHQVTRANGAEADAGRFLPGWVRSAGFEDVRVTSSTWTFADPETCRWWGELWADRVELSSFAEQAVGYGFADATELATDRRRLAQMVGRPRGDDRDHRRRGACPQVAVWAGPGLCAYTRCPMKRPYRVVVAKPGLDGHDRGAKVIARALRDAGFEVIYTGLHQTPEQVVQAVLQEDADAVGLSLLSGAHLTLVPKILDGLRSAGLGDTLVIVGGIIPDDDVPVLKEMGVAEIFTPGAPLPKIAGWLAETLDEREGAA